MGFYLTLLLILLSTGDRYVVETDGLLIRGVTPEDAGHYTCRARVLETGSLEERNIKLEVCKHNKTHIHNKRSQESLSILL